MEWIMGAALLYLLLDKFLPNAEKKVKPRYTPARDRSVMNPDGSMMSRIEKAKKEGHKDPALRAMVERLADRQKGK